MAVATFDTLKYSKALRAAGVSENEADAHVDAMKDAMQTNLKELVTKDDLKNELHSAETRLHSRVDLLEQKIKGEINILRWMIGSVGFGIVAILIRLFIFKTPF